MLTSFCRTVVLPFLAAALAASANGAGPDAVVILTERLITVDSSGEAHTTLRKVIQINNPRGRERLPEARFRYDPRASSLRVLSLARSTRDAAGEWRRQQFDPAAATEVRQAPDGLRLVVLHFPYATPGQRIDYAVRRRDKPPFQGHFSTVMLLADAVPVDAFRLEITAPREMTLYYRAWGCSIKPTQSLAGDQTRYVWASTQRMNPVAPAPRVFVSTDADWNRFGRWARRIYVRASEPTPTVRVAAARNRLYEGSPDERMRRALDFVRRQIRDRPSGPGSHPVIPADAESVLRARAGDCKAKSALLIALLAQAGIEAAPVLLEQLPSPYVFSHCIVKAVIHGRFVWLDPTTLRPPYPPAGHTPPVGLVVPLDGSEPSLEPVTLYDPSQ
ncbi:MAG: DUF3857 domain-containing protein [Armatimonadota bacterium]